ncbi:hypothetical protein BX666DRAFT_1995776 [Dichotomocladium elegans]|nr:hypothetical protein BX666DRAFT_1995776 [Dichotomocladium elegans]
MTNFTMFNTNDSFFNQLLNEDTIIQQAQTAINISAHYPTEGEPVGLPSSSYPHSFLKYAQTDVKFHPREGPHYSPDIGNQLTYQVQLSPDQLLPLAETENVQIGKINDISSVFSFKDNLIPREISFSWEGPPSHTNRPAHNSVYSSWPEITQARQYQQQQQREESALVSVTIDHPQAENNLRGIPVHQASTSHAQNSQWLSIQIPHNPSTTTIQRSRHLASDPYIELNEMPSIWTPQNDTNMADSCSTYYSTQCQESGKNEVNFELCRPDILQSDHKSPPSDCGSIQPFFPTANLFQSPDLQGRYCVTWNRVSTSYEPLLSWSQKSPPELTFTAKKKFKKKHVDEVNLEPHQQVSIGAVFSDGYCFGRIHPMATTESPSSSRLPQYGIFPIKNLKATTRDAKVTLTSWLNMVSTKGKRRSSSLVCMQCSGQDFGNIKTLRRHLYSARVHDPGPGIHCKACDLVITSRQDSYRRHLQTKRHLKNIFKLAEMSLQD